MKRIISLLTILMITLAYSSGFAANENGRDLVFDNAGVLSEQEFNNIEARLEEVSNAYDFDAVIAIVNNTGDKGIVSFSDDFFDYRGYGRGSNRSGVVMVISIGTDKRYISTSGDCINAYTDDIISYIGGDLAASVDNYSISAGIEGTFVLLAIAIACLSMLFKSIGIVNDVFGA